MTIRGSQTSPGKCRLVRWSLLIGLAIATSASVVFAFTQLYRQQAQIVGPVGAPTTTTAAGRFVLHETPQPSPDIEFADADNQPRRLSDFRGMVLLLNIWATWCVPCRKEMPQLDALQGKLGSLDFEVVAVSIDRGGIFVVKAFYDEIDAQHLRMFLDASGQVSRALNVVGLPTTLLVDRDGRELGRLIGPTDWTSAEVTELLQTILARPRTARDGESSPPSTM